MEASEESNPYPVLTAWQWCWHRLTGGCTSLPSRSVVMREALQLQEPPRLGEIWRICPKCGRVLARRIETAADAEQFDV